VCSSDLSLGKFFTSWSRPFRLIFFLYQVLAITLTVFALIRYGWMPLGLEPQILFLPLILLVILAAGILFGEEFNIRRIKWSHGVIFLIILGAVGILLTAPSHISPALPSITVEQLPTDNWNYWGYTIPIIIGFLAGVLCLLAIQLKFKFGYDDSLDVIGVHLVGGLVGALLLGFFADAAINPLVENEGLFTGGDAKLLWFQFVASAVTMVFSFVVSFIIAKAIDKTIGMRVSEDEENEGLDYSQHAETAYSFGSTGSMDRL
jgi:hypothetical protein